MRTRGLTLGKFAPLHKGHQLVIETALEEMDEVIVLIYDCPKTTRIPLPVRSAWIRRLHPTVKVIEAWDGPTEVGDTPEIKRRHDEYLLRRLGSRRITHFYSSEFYGDHVSAAFGAVNRIVDAERARLPVSGTAVRADPFAYRAYLDPTVYRDLITNAVFLGAPSTGKTTLAARLAQEYDTVWMPEYGREYWEQHQVQRRLSRGQLVEIAEEHLRREEEALYQARGFLFTDTNALTTYVFALDYHGGALPRLTRLAEQAAARYDLVFVCDADIPYEDTWDRSGAAHREVFQKRVLADLAMRRIPYFLLRGDLEQRVAAVKCVLERYPKYANLLAPVTAMLELFSVQKIAVTIYGYPMSYLELLGTIFNLWSVWLAVKNRVATWPVGLVGVVLFLLLFYQIRLYSDTFEQGYYLIASLYGWWRWATPPDPGQKAMLARRQSAPKEMLLVAVATLVIALAATQAVVRLHLWLPRLFPEAASYPFLDTLTTIMSLTATLLMAQRRIECWVYWILVDVIGIGLYYAKDVKVVAALYAVFLVLASQGFAAWVRDARLERGAALTLPGD